MVRKVVHEHKIPKTITTALYVIAIALTLNLAKPFVSVLPAWAELDSGDRLRVTITNWDDMRVTDSIYIDGGSISTCDTCR